MHYIKLSLWIFVLSVLYAMGIFNICGFYPELIFLFSCLYSPLAKTFKERIIVSLICGVLMSSFGGYGFVFSMLLTVYASLLFGLVFKGERIKYKSLIVCAVLFMTAVYDGMFGVVMNGLSWQTFRTVCFDALINGAFGFIMYVLIKKTFEEKERYIF